MHRVVRLRNVGLTVLASRGSKEPNNALAPKWVFNLLITSKANVYSYGIKVLEMVTGKSPTAIPNTDAQRETEQRGLIKWVSDRMNESIARGRGLKTPWTLRCKANAACAGWKL
ncbi:probably inactive leucine-rich repeat receptor-like protein kinase At5g48380 [Vitis vinifera]|uniref:probably inactive leucine-rich repeat receptor-like protein kinase At5g48380 n=1 Tax=Vitis vinifera TaxID=29760 RepID=UPI00053F445A|nr:probably inactive leucine-rich repeat receptor-like protein kinase At5g48380 [Vitis vinifera]|eukprot:XP_010665088.1 PREDICTED: probably inactive leucine-rich repeat receptor-like protein kinase At5g48380 [Vitis vinifera]